MKKTAIYQRKRANSSLWFNKWVQSQSWFFGFWIVVGVCLLIYAANAIFGRVHPGSPWGLSYGIVATVIFVAVLFYAVKRRTMRIRAMGRAWYYLQFHVYGGTLFLLLMFMHIGFKMPHGVLSTWLWGLSIWVVLSGFLGIVLQKWLPTLLNSGLSTEVHYDRIPELVDDLHTRAEKLVGTCHHTVRDFYRKNLEPRMAAPRTRPIYFLDITGGIHAHDKQFDHLRDVLPSDESEKLDELEEMYRTKMEMDAHYTLQKPLRWWLYLHVPISIALIALLGFHIFSVVYY